MTTSMTASMSLPIKRKAFAYITSGTTSGTTSGGSSGLTGSTSRHRLLVFSHPLSPEAGIQVPAGTMDDAETPEKAVMREAAEETGLPELKIVRMLGRQTFDARPFGRDELHDRWFFHLTCEAPTPDRWRHDETDPSESLSESIPFELFWVPLPDGVPDLIADHGRFLPELLDSLRS